MLHGELHTFTVLCVWMMSLHISNQCRRPHVMFNERHRLDNMSTYCHSPQDKPVNVTSRPMNVTSLQMNVTSLPMNVTPLPRISLHFQWISFRFRWMSLNCKECHSISNECHFTSNECHCLHIGCRCLWCDVSNESLCTFSLNVTH